MVTCVMFSPEDLDIVRGAPQGRRRFVDMLLSQCGAGYYYALQTYNSALKQRNALLHDLARGGNPPSWMRGTSSWPPRPHLWCARASTPRRI